MKYWVSFGAFQLFELVADFTIGYVLPFYNELKLASIIWLVMGTKLVFDTIVNRELTKREKSIDRCLNKVSKLRDEFIASLWFELSRSTINILRSLLTAILVSRSIEDLVEEDSKLINEPMDCEDLTINNNNHTTSIVSNNNNGNVITYNERSMRLRSSNVAQGQYLFIENGHSANSTHPESNSVCQEQPMDGDQV